MTLSNHPLITGAALVAPGLNGATGLGRVVICWLTGIVSRWTGLSRGVAVPAHCPVTAPLLFALTYRTLSHGEALILPAGARRHMN